MLHSIAMSRWALLTTLLVCACNPSPALAPSVQPSFRIDPSTRDLSTCTAESLRTLGSHESLRPRGPVHLRKYVVRRHVGSETVHCGPLPATECLDAAQPMAVQRARERSPSLQAEVTIGLDERGNLAELSIDGVVQEQRFSDARAYIEHIRSLETAGHQVRLMSESRAFEHDFDRVDIVYIDRDPKPHDSPAVELQWRVPTDRRSVWESWRLLHDELAHLDAVLDQPSERRVADFVVQHLVPPEALDRPDRFSRFVAMAASLQAIPPRTPVGPTVAVPLVVRCRIEAK